MAADKTPFSQQIAYLNKGMLDAELTDTLADVVQAVRETRKQGTVTVTLKVGMMNRATEDMVKITPQVTHKAPTQDQPEAIMWSTHDGDLLRDDPEQQKLELREAAPREEQQVRETGQHDSPLREVGGQ